MIPKVKRVRIKSTSIVKCQKCYAHERLCIQSNFIKLFLNTKNDRDKIFHFLIKINELYIYALYAISYITLLLRAGIFTIENVKNFGFFLKRKLNQVCQWDTKYIQNNL